MMKKITGIPKKKLLPVLAGCAALIPLLLLIGGYLPGMGGEGKEENASSVSPPIPEADIEQSPEGKTDSYVRSGISDYWASLEEQEGGNTDGMAEDTDGDVLSRGRGGRRPGSVSVDDIFGDVKGTQGASGRSSGGSPQGRPRPKEESERPAPESGSQDGAAAPSRIQVRKSGAISSLDDGAVSDPTTGISTLDGSDVWVQGESGKPYRCMFTRNEKVSAGQRISLRLLEDLVIDGVHIPQNTHLQGVCSISDRMEVSITSLDMGGRILSFHFEAYDTDGGKGIYCSDLTKAKKEITNQGISTVMSGLNSRLGSAARDAANLGASMVRSKTGETTVSVPAGYTFYIVEEKRF